MPTISSKDSNASPAKPLQAASIARGLGWFSLALGAAELLAPRSVARGAGVSASASLMRLYGLREIACGIGILTSRDPSPFLWARAGGDVLDLFTLLSKSDKDRRSARRRAIGSLINVAGVTALDVHAAMNTAAPESNRADTIERMQYYESLYRDRSGFPRPPEEMRGAAASSEMRGK